MKRLACALLLAWPAAGSWAAGPSSPSPAASRPQGSDFSEAVALFKRLIARHPKDKKLWWDLIYGYADRQEYREAADWLERYTKAFPDDPKGAEELIGVYQALGDTTAAARLLREQFAKDPRDRKRAKRLAEALLNLKLYSEAEALAAERLKAAPDGADWLFFMAEAQSSSGKPREAARYFKRLLEVKGADLSLLKQYGIYAFFSSDYGAAREALSQALKLGPEDAEALYYLSETEAASGRKTASVESASRALEKARGKRTLGERELLRLEGRVGWSDDIEGRYRLLASSSTLDETVLTDWIAGLLDHGHGARVGEPLELLKKRFPADADRYVYDARSRQRDWPAAESSARDWTFRKPQDGEALKALGESAYHCGLWNETAGALGRLTADERPCYLREMAWNVDRFHSDMAGAGFRYYGLPQDLTMQADLSGRVVSGRLVWDGLARQGTYQVSSKGYYQEIADGQVRATYEGFYPYRLGLSAAGTAGYARNELSPGVYADYGGGDLPEVHASYRYHDFWNDQSLPASEGTLADDTRLWADGTYGRVYAHLEYQYNHYTLTGGPMADREQFLPQIGFIVRPGGFCGGPYAALGYQFILDDVTGQDEFFARLPLVTRSRTHCATALLSDWWKPGVLQAELSGNVCRDAGRSIPFGGLFEVSGHLRWAIRPWLDALTGYEYGHENTLTGVGVGNTVTFRLEAYGDGKLWR
jgi:tetratricopeptide (TPR) repeat protein